MLNTGPICTKLLIKLNDNFCFCSVHFRHVFSVVGAIDRSITNLHYRLYSIKKECSLHQLTSFAFATRCVIRRVPCDLVSAHLNTPFVIFPKFHVVKTPKYFSFWRTFQTGNVHCLLFFCKSWHLLWYSTTKHPSCIIFAFFYICLILYSVLKDSSNFLNFIL